ncbi:MAG: NAD(P)H-dependent oxidoreductase, partial [Treponema sp.]|nr:NAD(P)H-dependent oxidoreductase [Treponema sp.]
HPEDEIVTLDLYKAGIGPLKAEDLPSLTGPKNESSRNDPVLRYAYQWADCDKYVIAAPLWNLGLPGILKCYIDYAWCGGITFVYTENGPKGLLENKKGIYIATRGGDYSSDLMKENEMGARYISTLFRVFGIEDFQTLYLDKMDVWGTDIPKAMSEGIERAEMIARDF